MSVNKTPVVDVHANRAIGKALNEYFRLSYCFNTYFDKIPRLVVLL